MAKGKQHCLASHLQKTKSLVKYWKYFPNASYSEWRRSDSPGLRKCRWRAVADETEAFRALLYTSSDHQWDVSHALCKSFLRVAKLCFAVRIISLIVLIVLLSDAIMILFLIPSHVTNITHLVFYLILWPWQSHLAADIVPGPHWSWNQNESRCMWGLYQADKQVSYTIFHFSSSKSGLQIVGWLIEVLPIASGAEMWETATVPRVLRVNWYFSTQLKETRKIHINWGVNEELLTSKTVKSRAAHWCLTGLVRILMQDLNHISSLCSIF